MSRTILPPPSLQARLESCTRIPPLSTPVIPSDESVLAQCEGVGEFDQWKQQRARKKVEQEMKNSGWVWDGRMWRHEG